MSRPSTRSNRAEKLAAVGRLAAGVVHEINNPLATIAACAEALEQRVDEGAFEPSDAIDDLTEYLGLIKSEAFRCKSITTGLLDFSRTPHRRASSTRRRRDRSLVGESHLAPETWQPIVKVEIDTADDLPVINADGGQIQQAVIALATNAIDAMPDGGTLTFRVFAKRHRRIAIEVEDTGVGIPHRRHVESLRAVLYDQRGRQRHRPRPRGLLRHHHRPRRPSQRSLHRRQRHDLHDLPPGRKDARHQPHMAKLLVVDDEKNLRLVVQKEMTRQGHDVETAADGEAAWEMLEAQDFDVLLCDINMPRLDGIGLLRRVREKSQNPPEVIMLTGQATVESAIEAMKLGAYDYLTKPYRIGELSALVDRGRRKTAAKGRQPASACADRPHDRQPAGDRRRVAADERSCCDSSAASLRRTRRF